MIAFVHGVPETAAIWRKVRAAIGRESVALALPGFGCPRPDGFDATKDEYVAWVAGELERLGEEAGGPVHLVGHDWGAILAFRLATAHGHLLRSWVADVGNLAHPDYAWHAFAQIWQTPGEGEAFFEASAASSDEDTATGLQAMGLSFEDALEMASAGDEVMGDSILRLYRSATPNVFADWGPWSPSPAPGLIVHPSDDPFSDEAMATEAAALLGARVQVLEGAGHFWPYQAPEPAAKLLNAFWDSLD